MLQKYFPVIVALLPVLWDLVGWGLDRMKVVGEEAINHYLKTDRRVLIKDAFSGPNQNLLLKDIGSHFKFAEIVNTVIRYHILLMLSIWFSVIELQHKVIPYLDWHGVEVTILILSLIVFSVLLRRRFYLPSDGKLVFLPRIWIYVLFILVISSEVVERLGAEH